jgi:alcohol dehydrogenase YqhD (iron-dependent ADH family)
MEAYYREIGLPTRLSDLDIGSDRLDEMAEKCVGKDCVGEFKELYKDDVLEIYKLALK